MLDNLPDAVMAEILCRLPMKSIIKCTCVCKSWNSLIKSPNFIATHLHKPLSSCNKIRNRPLFFHRLYIHGDPRQFYKRGDYQYLLHFDNKDLDGYLSLHPPFDPDDRFDVVGSCNGVICFERYCSKLILWNPYIRKSFLLPSPLFPFVGGWPHSHLFGLGFDSRTCDYKVLRIMNDRVGNGQFGSELYSLNSNSWKVISDIAPGYSLGYSVATVFVNDALHWIVKVSRHFNCSRIENFEGNLVAVFDFRDEVFRQILLPKCLVNVRESDLDVKVFGELSIAVVHCDPRDRDNVSHIWVMKEYGVVTSWVKLGSVGKRYRGPSKVLEFRNNGEVLIQFHGGRGGLASQSIMSQRLKNFKGYRWVTSDFYPYVENLALLDKGEDAGNARYARGEGSSSKKAKAC